MGERPIIIATEETTTASGRSWHVYMVRCADGTLYTGISCDVARRLREHNGSSRGARYTRSRRPVKLVYTASARDRSAAQRAEAALRKLPRPTRLRMAAEWLATETEFKEEDGSQGPAGKDVHIRVNCRHRIAAS